LKNNFLNKEEAKKKQIIHVVTNSQIKFLYADDTFFSWDINLIY